MRYCAIIQHPVFARSCGVCCCDCVQEIDGCRTLLSRILPVVSSLRSRTVHGETGVHDTRSSAAHGLTAHASSARERSRDDEPMTVINGDGYTPVYAIDDPAISEMPGSPLEVADMGDGANPGSAEDSASAPRGGSKRGNAVLSTNGSLPHDPSAAGAAPPEPRLSNKQRRKKRRLASS